MTNAALQAIIAEYGERIFCITLDNNHKIMLGLQSRLESGNGFTVNDIQYKTFGDTDMFGFWRTDHTWNNQHIKYINWMVTGCIQAVHVTEEMTTYLPDLNRFF